jgi:hypothetical protein
MKSDRLSKLLSNNPYQKWPMQETDTILRLSPDQIQQETEYKQDLRIELNRLLGVGLELSRAVPWEPNASSR